MIPSAIELHKQSRILELRYKDGQILKFDAEYLRVYSPSAEVRGHHPSQAVLQHGKKHVELTAITAVGNYAIQLTFNDGHDSGIFSWDYLYDLGKNREQYWQDYLQLLTQEGKTRDPEAQVINLLDPRK